MSDRAVRPSNESLIIHMLRAMSGGISIADPTRLDAVQASVDTELAAVAKSYGWTDHAESMADEDILGRLLGLNLERSSNFRGA